MSGHDAEAAGGPRTRFSHPIATLPPARLQAVRRVVGGFFLTTAGINAGITIADPNTYQHFADPAALAFVRNAWQTVVMAAPSFWGFLLAAGELVIGVLLLRGGTAARLGWAGVLLFHVLLMFFGPGIWLWSLPVLALLTPVVTAEWPLLGQRKERRSHWWSSLYERSALR